MSRGRGRTCDGTLKQSTNLKSIHTRPAVVQQLIAEAAIVPRTFDTAHWKAID
jgi:hypothetical protein